MNSYVTQTKQPFTVIIIIILTIILKITTVVIIFNEIFFSVHSKTGRQTGRSSFLTRKVVTATTTTTTTLLVLYITYSIKTKVSKIRNWCAHAT